MHWIGVIEGELWMVRFSKNGKMTALSRVPAHEWIGEASLIFLSQREFDLVAKRESRIACMSKDGFAWLYGKSISFNNHLIAKLAQRMDQLANMLAVDRLTGMTARIAYCLVNIAIYETPLTEDGWLKMSQEELGSLAGLSRQHVNRVVAELARDGHVLLNHGRIAIRNLTALEALAEL
jgi:CRP/FNR family transcriptional regulator, cyclic AMP receptor protein